MNQQTESVDTNKSSTFNAQLTSVAVAGGYLRTILGALVVALVWLCLGWALASWSLGLGLAAWSLFVGPMLIPLVLWHSFRRRGKLRALHVTSDKDLANEMFKSILRAPGANPLIYVRPAADLSSFWIESSLFAPRSRQVLVLTTAWMEQAPAQRAEDWQGLWTSISRRTVTQRRLQALQFLLWQGALSPLEPLVYVMGFALDVVGFSDIPHLSFWLQRLCWDLRQFWFGLPHRSEVERLRKPERGEAVIAPKVWHSLCLGVWFEMPFRGVHPLWPILTHSEAFLES